MINSGSGWRIGYRAENLPYIGLIGGESWAAELMAEEWQSLCDLLPQLLTTIESIKTELSEEENFDCTLESEYLYLGVSGSTQQWQLRIQTRSGRQFEGFLSSESVLEMWDFVQELG